MTTLFLVKAGDNCKSRTTSGLPCLSLYNPYEHEGIASYTLISFRQKQSIRER